MKGIRIKREALKKIFSENNLFTKELDVLKQIEIPKMWDYEDILIGIDDSIFGSNNGDLTFIKHQSKAFTTALKLTSTAPSVLIKSWKDVSGEWKYIVS